MNPRFSAINFKSIKTMVTLYDALESINYKSRPSIKKHLKANSICTWDDLDRWHLARLATRVKDSMSASSAHTTFAVLKSFLSKFEDEIALPKGWRKILECKNEAPMKTYLTAREVETFGDVEVCSDVERTVRDGFYVSCKTGLRHSDLVKLRPSNFLPCESGGWYLNYVSQKTKIHSTLPCSDATRERVKWLRAKGADVSLAYYNQIVRILAERAKINTEVSVFRAGKELSGPKYKFLSSHSARISFCTVLADLGVGVGDIARMAGHSDPSTTYKRYIVNKAVKLSPKALGFLM